MADNVSYDTDAVATYAVGAQPSNWDIHSASASASYPVLEQVLAQVWPSAFYVETSGAPVLNTSLLSSATEVSSDPQTIVYQINARAEWSDGTPITYRDFAYNWQAQSGKTKFSDVGGKPYTALDDDGYDDIATVGGNPAAPYTVTVIFSSPYPDWRSLFSYLMPAHIARDIGFDDGFSDPVADLVSGGPYLVSQVQEGYSLELVRNANYWGNPANLSAVTYYFTSGAAQMVNALSAGELDVAVLTTEPSAYRQLQATAGLAVAAVASNTYEDLDFNETGGPLANPVLRQAITMTVDRSAVANSVLGPYGLSATPVDNRLLLADETGYSADGADYDHPASAAALHLLMSNGYTYATGATSSSTSPSYGGKAGMTVKTTAPSTPAANPGANAPAADSPAGKAPAGNAPAGNAVARGTATAAAAPSTVAAGPPVADASTSGASTTTSTTPSNILKSPDGKPVTLSLYVSSADPVAEQLATQVVSTLATIGVSVSVTGTGSAGGGSGSGTVATLPGSGAAATLPGPGTTAALPAGWQMAIELRQIPEDPALIASRYATGGTANVDGYSSTVMNALLAQIPTSPAAQLPGLYDQIDAVAWKDFVDLPLVQLPLTVALNDRLLNVEPGPYVGNIAWDEEVWGFRAS